MKYDRVVIKKSTNPKKKLMAVFSSKDSSRTKTTHFGSAGMSDFPTHKDVARKQRYLDRHRKRENWQERTSAGALARWILWNKTSRRSSISDFKSRFNLK